MVTPTTDPFDNVCIVDLCSGLALNRSWQCCDGHFTQVQRYMRVCRELDIPIEIGRPGTHDADRLMSKVEILFAAVLFDQWASSADDMEIVMLLKGM